ncbi:MAG: hypothetical protein LBL01_07860, partial [Bifidobacteriaceae bacterium]|nr:hypothetical protein [Bifidobacteriaceae bacterium]
MTSAGEAKPPALTEVEALRLVNDPTAGPEALAAAVAAFPELLPQAAAHHGASPDLLAWAQSLGRPEVDAALAARAAGAPMFAAAAPPRGRRARRRPRLKSRWTA